MKAAQAKGRELPDWYVEEPCLFPGDEFYLKAFWDLSTGRMIGFAIGPIPWRDIVVYAERAQLADDVAGVFIFVMREMDAAYLKYVADKQEKGTLKARPSRIAGRK